VTEVAGKYTHCRVCGAEIEIGRFNPPLESRMVDTGHCFNCMFWVEKIAWREAGDVTEQGQQVLRVDGQHYVVNSAIDAGERAMLGHGGRRFRYRLLKDGMNSPAQTTHNLWSQGHIPDRFKDQLPDNAVLFGWLKGERALVFMPDQTHANMGQFRDAEVLADQVTGSRVTVRVAGVGVVAATPGRLYPIHKKEEK